MQLSLSIKCILRSCFNSNVITGKITSILHSLNSWNIDHILKRRQNKTLLLFSLNCTWISYHWTWYPLYDMLRLNVYQGVQTTNVIMRDGIIRSQTCGNFCQSIRGENVTLNILTLHTVKHREKYIFITRRIFIMEIKEEYSTHDEQNMKFLNILLY